MFEQWAVYDAVVQHDYMRHAGLAQARANGRPGSGPPRESSTWGAATRAWRQADSSRPRSSITWASTWRRRRWNGPWLTRRNGPGRWISSAAIMRRRLRRLPDRSANAVLASYSLHHFSTADKVQLLGEIWCLLEPAGAAVDRRGARRQRIALRLHSSRLTGAITHDWVGLTEDQRRARRRARAKLGLSGNEILDVEQVQTAGFEVGGVLLDDKLFDGWEFLKPGGTNGRD